MKSLASRLGFWVVVLAILSAVNCGQSKTDDAYVTLLYGDEFLLGVRVLGKSIRDTGSTKDMVALVSDGVSDYAEKLLRADGWIVQHISLLANPNSVRPKRFWGVYTKLKIFNMTNYRKVVYLDADTIVIKSIDDLFKCRKFCANLKHSERLNSGVMVVEPSESIFTDMMSKVTTLYSYTGGDQGFLNTYYSDFPNAHLFEPDLSTDAMKTRPVPEMERLSTLYNADVGLYMLANKVLKISLMFLIDMVLKLSKMLSNRYAVHRAHLGYFRSLGAIANLVGNEAIDGYGFPIEVERLGEAVGWLNLWGTTNKGASDVNWMVDEKELKVIHYTLGPLKPWDWWTAWLLKPVDVWQNVRVKLEESLPGTGGGRNPHDQLSLLLASRDFTTKFSRSSVIDYVRRICLHYRSGTLPTYSGAGVASSSFVNTNQQFFSGTHSKLPCYLGPISVVVCFMATAFSLGDDISSYRCTFITIPVRNHCSLRKDFLKKSDTLLVVPTLGLMVGGGLVFSAFLAFASEHLAIRAFIKGCEDFNQRLSRNICLC
ncbi:hypothetical protein ZIOFF_018893 [Zingiber officinale]|uniref:Hexosyltransferase n=1 Tax=Zingiber officinale TaxID=94328 RepID=A0A8J5H8V5_ZINOF|nr:hypothetical protein ZIOFF_018893 [Zingiber officinale]